MYNYPVCMYVHVSGVSEVKASQSTTDGQTHAGNEKWKPYAIDTNHVVTQVQVD